MIKVYADNGYISVEQESMGRITSIILSYVEVDKLREDLIRAQMKIKDACKVTFVKEEK
jgi:hypothetical protein